MIASGAIEKDQTFDKEYNITIDPTWTNDVYVVCVLWKKDGSAPAYKYVNAFFDKAKITEPTE